MKLTEQSLQALEAHIPELACDAFQKAYFEALTESGTVLRAINGQLVETHVEGMERFVRALNAPTQVTLGLRLTRRTPPR